MVNRFRISQSLLARLDELGVAPSRVLAEARLPPALLEQEKIFLTTEELFAFYRGLERASSDRAIGLRLGHELRIERYDAIAIAAVSARSLRDALGRLARYKQLCCPEELRLIEDPQSEECRAQFRWMLAVETEPPLLEDLCFAFLVAIARRGSGERVRPRRIELAGPERDRKLYEEHFGCPVRCGVEESGVIFAKSDLDRPFLTHNADLLAALIPQLDQQLEQASAPRGLNEQVKSRLKRQLAGRRPGLAEVAKELRLSPRTLQRRLTESGLSFQQLLQEARRELARHYLLNSDLELNETAYLLGYDDAHSFFRAFQGWEGKTPGEFRGRAASAS